MISYILHKKRNGDVGWWWFNGDLTAWCHHHLRIVHVITSISL